MQDPRFEVGRGLITELWTDDALHELYVVADEPRCERSSCDQDGDHTDEYDKDMGEHEPCA